MSATPLSAINVAPASAPSTAQPTNGQGDHDAAFDAHLQDARRQQSSSSDSGASTDASGSKQPTASSSAAQGASQSAPAATDDAPVADADGDATAAGNATDASLASAVLGLIDRSSAGAKDADAPNAATDGHNGAAKPKAQAASATTSAPATSLPGAIALLQPPALPPAGFGQGQGGSAATAAATIGASAAPGRLPSGLALDKGFGAASTDDADDADDGDGAAGSAAGGSDSSLAQLAGGAASLLAGDLSCAGHAAPAQSASAAVAVDSAPDSPDPSALSGMLNLPALAVPANGGASAHALTVNTPVNASGFARELGQQVAWLGGQDIKQAQIRLNPQELGPLDVKVSVEHGRVDVVFMAQHPAAVSAVQQSLGQLNQMLGGQGLSLGQAMVGQHAAQQQFGGGSQGNAPSSGNAAASEGDESVEAVAEAVARPLALGLVDAFA